MAEKLTISDIARIAGVSKATVSRVLNNKPDVDAATRERIWQIINERDYTPSLFATVQAGGKSRLVGIMIPSLTWPLIPEIMRGVAEVIEASPYEIVLYGMVHQESRGDLAERIVTSKLTSGLLAILPGPAMDQVTALNAHGFPVVVIDDQGLPTDAPWVGADNRQGAMLATQHLLALGHRRIAHIKGPERYRCSHDRYAGYVDALRDAGIMVDPELVAHGDFEQPSGYAAALTLLDRADSPTAIFAGNDMMAYGVMQYAKECHITIPRDLALIGFDDTTPSNYMHPPLTTVRQPFYEMGRQGMELLLAMIETPRPVELPGSPTRRLLRVLPPPHIELQTSLVLRESTAAAAL